MTIEQFRLKKICGEKNISLYKLAEMTNISYSTLHKLASGKSKGITLEVLEKICIALECTPNDLLLPFIASKNTNY